LYKPVQWANSHNVLLFIHRILSSVLPTFDVKIKSDREYILEGDSQLQGCKSRHMQCNYNIFQYFYSGMFSGNIQKCFKLAFSNDLRQNTSK